MEIVTGVISIKKIFEINWISFLHTYWNQVRDISKAEIQKILACRSEKKWFITYRCPDCGDTKRLFFSCRSRFCNSCWTPASDKRLNGLISWRPKHLKYYHFAFTIPPELRQFFLSHRKALRILQQTSYQVIQYHFSKKHKITTGTISVIHTFWAQLNWNPHVHMIVTAWWFDQANQYIPIDFIAYKALISSRKYQLLKNLKHWCYNHIVSEQCDSYIKLINFLYNQENDTWEKKSRYVYFSKPWYFHTVIMKYISRYLKRPTIGQSRITWYTDSSVSYIYKDKYDWDTKENTVSIPTFIQLLIQHIPKRYFHMVSYNGAFSNRMKNIYLTVLKHPTYNNPFSPIVPKNYAHRFFRATGTNPFQCPCWSSMHIYTITIPWYPTKYFDTS
jgi:hypothetical protein